MVETIKPAGSEVPLNPEPALLDTQSANADDEFRTPDGRPRAMGLDLPGAVGTHFGLYKMDKARPELRIDGRYPKRSFRNDYEIQMVEGGFQWLKIKSRIPGYHTVTFNGQVLYAPPKAPASIVAAYVLAIVAGGVVGVFLGGIGLIIGGFYGGQGAALWAANARDRGPVLAAIFSISGAIIVAAAFLVAALVFMN